MTQPVDAVTQSVSHVTARWPGKAPIAVALDAPDVDIAAGWSQAVSPHVAVVKVGLQLFCRYGPAVVDAVRGGTGVGLFLDLKLHDIPATVAGAARAVAGHAVLYEVGLPGAGCQAEVFFSDLSYEYVKINAEYTT